MNVKATTGVYANLEKESPEFLKRLDATLAEVTTHAISLRDARHIFADRMPEMWATYGNDRVFLARYTGPTLIILTHE